MGQKLKILTEYWLSNPDVWFGCSSEVDKYIINEFGDLLDSDITEMNLGTIILWDQISRHVYRDDLIKIKYYHTKSLNLSFNLLYSDYDTTLTPNERCFLLMPLRHTFEKVYLEIVIEKVKDYMKMDGFDPYRRFYRVTLLSYSKIITEELVPEDVNNTITDESIINILDKKSNSTIISCNEILKNDVYKTFEKFIKSYPSKGIVISISGGVDSMLCSYVLSRVRIKYPNLNIIAVMVNYNNRKECITETQFVTRWLKSLNIPLYVRHIKYLRRKSEDDLTDRNFYEAITKQFRFDLYKRFGYPVILGHNKDDCIENIFTNVRKGRSYDNLNGMKSVSLVNEIIFYRPMLEITKLEIYNFAKNYKIPYLADSTPEWSDRGRIRDDLIPFLNTFDPSLIPGLINLSKSISELSRCQTIMVDMFVKNIIIKENEAVMIINETDRTLGFDFWKKIVRYVVDNLNIGMCTNKSIHTLLKHLKIPRRVRTNLSKNLEVVHNINSLVFCVKE